MSNDDNSLTEIWVSHDIIECLLYLMLRFGIESRSGFIKKKNFRLSNQSSSDRNSLLLATRELNTSFTDNCVIAIWEFLLILHETKSICFSASLIHFFNSGLVTKSISNIFFDRSREKYGFLLYDSKILFVTLRIKVF